MNKVYFYCLYNDEKLNKYYFNPTFMSGDIIYNQKLSPFWTNTQKKPSFIPRCNIGKRPCKISE